MQAGQFDGFAISPPAIHVAEKEFNSTILVNLAAGELPSMDGYFYIGMMARDDWYQNNIDTAARVLKGLKMAMDAVHDPKLNAQEAQATYNKFYSDMNRDLFQRAWDNQSNSVPKTLDMDTATLTEILDFYNCFAETPLSADLIPESVTTEVVEASRDINLTVVRGKFIALVGPSGCGKSTLLNRIAGIFSTLSRQRFIRWRPCYGL